MANGNNSIETVVLMNLFCGQHKQQQPPGKEEKTVQLILLHRGNANTQLKVVAGAVFVHLPRVVIGTRIDIRGHVCRWIL